MFPLNFVIPRRRGAVLIASVLFAVGFIVEVFFLREHRFSVNKEQTVHIAEKALKVKGQRVPVRVKPKSGGVKDQSQMQSPRGSRTSMDSALLDNPDTEHCQRKSHIVFLNTHQTEGSKIQNILYRYGENRGLTFALPKNRDTRFSYPEYFKAQFVEGVNGDSATKFHILCNDMRFRKSEVAKVMPEDTFYFSILRHPVLLVQSAFMFLKASAIFPGNHVLDSLVEDSLTNPMSPNKSAFNNLAFDFGFDNLVTTEAKNQENKAAKVIANMEKDFHLLLINEYFDESLVLLKHTLCWSLEDVATFMRRNAHQRPLSLLPDTVEDIKTYKALDWKIYRHFNATFWHKVESVVGMKEMKREVSELRQLQAKLTHSCLAGVVAPYHNNNFGVGKLSLGFNLNTTVKPEIKRKCQKCVTPVLQYTYNLYNKQFSKKAAKL